MSDENVWRPSRARWAGPDGVVWRRQQKWLTERDARRFFRRKTGRVAVEASASQVLTWLRSEERAAFWGAHVAGHVDDLQRHVPRNEKGVTYHVSVWKSETGERLTLLSEMC
ncbi:hypothetical protein D0T12_28065 [Actinomadura spongiicola]|uniref:Uncharacterized protein n=1 Tax=Actinomadura spongiicola TaxID=2303421 RepID=A0A372G9N8_9ACTN|nr:hypothetical protein [Actinomadura spongiicola]RFS82106.1 hypothetical protein D0T12_28065 [Actinomadura spongiicola]